MNVFIPFSNLVFGHTKSQWVGMGKPLPKKVARQWQQWCNHGGYVKAALGRTIHEHLYDQLAVPSLWVNSADDSIALDVNVDDMLSVYTNLPAERIRLDPNDYEIGSIGHMEFFRKKSSDLWKLTTDWLDKHSA